jgi:lysophospholipase L1-like esterase
MRIVARCKHLAGFAGLVVARMDQRAQPAGGALTAASERLETCGGKGGRMVCGFIPEDWIARTARAAALAAVLAVAGPGVAAAQAPGGSSVVEVCLSANRQVALGVPLPRAAARLKSGEVLRLVAVGSSSTTGLWVLRRGGTYPEVMARELAALRPRSRIEVVNSGQVGDTITGMVGRFGRDVLAYRPDLVVWQLGTNDVAWGGSAGGLKELIVNGVRALRAAGPDVILMDLQYAPMVLASSQHPFMQAMIAEAARQERVGLFSRFAVMRRSVESGLPPGALVSWDGLHNSADGYECIGRSLARAIDAAAR